jgi:hypothetical protein
LLYFAVANQIDYTMDVLLQNNPGDRVFPAKIKWRYFEQSKNNYRGLYLLAVFLFMIGVVLALGIGIYLFQGGRQVNVDYPLNYVPPIHKPTVWPAVAAMIGSITAFILIGRYVASGPKREQAIYYKNSGAKVLSEEKRQALKLDLVSSYYAGFWSETLEYYPLAALKGSYHYKHLKPEQSMRYRKQLDKDWNILTTEDYYAVSGRLLSEGYHARSFAVTIQLKNENNTVSKRLAGLTELPESYVLSCLQPGANGRPPKLTWAFEYWRAVILARHAFMAGYITEERAWDDLLRAASLSFEIFESFEDFNNNYRLGHAFWSYALEATKEKLDRYNLYKAQCNWPQTKLQWPAPKGIVLPAYITNGFANDVAEARSTIGQQGSLN